ncbi:hypothetical protein Scep_011712 [Stephania cephalantha]|uniref:Uncharacterized protein n=1 Tax=Stephania cephalantha TaxID=152367 RepID=A0AAP0JDV8_9MAGN
MPARTRMPARGSDDGKEEERQRRGERHGATARWRVAGPIDPRRDTTTVDKEALRLTRSSPDLFGHLERLLEKVVEVGVVVSEITRRNVGFVFQTHMALKTGVYRERVYGQSSKTERAMGTLDTRCGRKPQTTLYRKEKQKAIENKVAHVRSHRRDGVQDEASQVHEWDLHIGRDESGDNI